MDKNADKKGKISYKNGASIKMGTGPAISGLFNNLT